MEHVNPSAVPTPDLTLQIKPDWHRAVTEFQITDKFVRWGKEGMHFKDISRVRAGNWRPNATTTIFYFIFKSNKGVELEVGFNTLGGSMEVQHGNYIHILDKLQEVYGNAIIKRFHQILKSGAELKFGVFTATKKGISVDKKSFWGTKQFLIPWEKLGLAIGSGVGTILVFDKQNNDATVNFKLFEEWNGHYFAHYMQQVQNDLKLLAELKA